jgi:predicted dienelactone hydrolase
LKEKVIASWVCSLILIAVSSALPADTQMKKSAQPDFASSEVDTVSYNWFDSDRQREVPVKIFMPRTGEDPYPVVFFSHGLGGTRED